MCCINEKQQSVNVANPEIAINYTQIRSCSSHSLSSNTGRNLLSYSFPTIGQDNQNFIRWKFLFLKMNPQMVGTGKNNK